MNCLNRDEHKGRLCSEKVGGGWVSGSLSAMTTLAPCGPNKKETELNKKVTEINKKTEQKTESQKPKETIHDNVRTLKHITVIEAYNCNYCDFKSSWKTLLKEHMKKKHKRQNG